MAVNYAMEEAASLRNRYDNRYDYDVPADGDYTVNIADIYRIEISKKEPELSLTLPPQRRATPSVVR